MLFGKQTAQQNGDKVEEGRLTEPSRLNKVDRPALCLTYLLQPRSRFVLFSSCCLFALLNLPSKTKTRTNYEEQNESRGKMRFAVRVSPQCRGSAFRLGVASYSSSDDVRRKPNFLNKPPPVSLAPAQFYIPGPRQDP